MLRYNYKIFSYLMMFLFSMESFAIDEVLDLKLSSLSENDIALIYPVIIDSNADKIISTTPFSNDVIFLHHVEAESRQGKS
ncbi:hypothetical protein ACP5PY_05785 [Photobacterium leiognathi subsp. mandapamensis]